MPEHRYGDKFSYWKPPDGGKGEQTTLRKRILRESSNASSQQHRRTAQQRFFKAPSFSGAGAFDLKSGETLPPAKRQRNSPPTIVETAVLDEDVEAIENADTWSDYVYHSRVLAELEDIKTATVVPSPGTDELSSCGTFDDVVPELPTFPQHTSHPTEYPAQTLSSMPATSLRLEIEPDHLQPPVEAYQLTAESHKIYSELVYDAQTLQASLPIDQQCRTVDPSVQAYFSLLRRHHDFFVASQHPSAPRALRIMTAKYAMPNRLWQKTIKTTFDALLADTRNSEVLALFAQYAYQEMNNLSQNVPQMQHEWDLIKYNIDKYFAALRADGIDIPLYTALSSNAWQDARKVAFGTSSTPLPPLSSSPSAAPAPGFVSADFKFFGDDKLVESYFYNHLQGYTNIYVDPYDLWTDNFSVPRIGHLLMSNWLAYGRKIATSFHAFAQTFFFLGLLCDLHPFI